MKIHSYRKVYRAWLKRQAKDGKMNNAAGHMVNRSGQPDTSMKRDYHPQVGAK